VPKPIARNILDVRKINSKSNIPIPDEKLTTGKNERKMKHKELI
jgi:hypothetical protein